MSAHTGTVTCLAMTGDDSKVVSGGEDGRIFVIPKEVGNCVGLGLCEFTSTSRV